MKKQTIVSLLILGALILTGCTKKAAANDNAVKVGILQLTSQTALDEARSGFKAELKKAGYSGKKIKFDYQNAQGDQANLKSMSERLKADKNDLNLALATQAAQALQKVDNQTPLIFTAVTDAKEAGLTSSNEHPSQNATGVVDLVDAKIQIDYLHHVFPKAKKIGLIYNASETNSQIQIKAVEKELRKIGLKTRKITVSTTNDVQQATESLVNKVDLIYAPTDNTIAAAMPTVGKVSLAKNVPVIPGASTMVKDGGVTNKGIDYRNLGAQAAKQAIKILKGKKIKDLAIEKPQHVKIIKNKKMMKKFHLTDEMLR